MRKDGRERDQIRPVKIINNYLMSPQGSVLIEMGNTKVICTATVEESTARHLTGTGKGWVTAEYAMIPGSTAGRKKRDRGKTDGRSVEIQRLIAVSYTHLASGSQEIQVSLVSFPETLRESFPDICSMMSRR